MQLTRLLLSCSLVAAVSTGCGIEDFDPDGLDLGFTGSGFDAHEGQTLWVAVIQSDTSATVGTDSAAIFGGDFDFFFPGLLEAGFDYEILYFADADGDGNCERAADRAWRVQVPASTTAVTVDETYRATSDPSACDAFGRL